MIKEFLVDLANRLGGPCIKSRNQSTQWAKVDAMKVINFSHPD